VKNLSVDDPEQIGPYEIIGVLGEGGMGRVYLGSRDQSLFAVKVISSRFAPDPTARQRFRREIEASGRVSSRFTARIVDHEIRMTGLSWYASEYIPGPTLEEAVRIARFRGDALAQFAYGLYEALKAIHAAGIVHRDLKPSNIILGADGVRVIDFGIAYTPGASQLTELGSAIGTPAYMSPEQARGQKPEPAGDIFSYGGLLVFAATGHAPFSGLTPLAVLEAVRTKDPDVSGVPQEVRAIVQHCLVKEPRRRASMSDIYRMIPKVKTSQAHTTKWMPEQVATNVEAAELAATKLERLPRTRRDPEVHARPRLVPSPVRPRRAPGVGGIRGRVSVLETGEKRRYRVSDRPGRGGPDGLSPAIRAVRPGDVSRRRHPIWPYVLVMVLLGLGAGGLWLVDGSFARLHRPAELQYLPQATFKQAALTNTNKARHVTKIDFDYRLMILTVKLDGNEQARKTALLQSCVKVTLPGSKKGDYDLFTSDDVDAAASKIYLGGLLDVPGEMEFTSPCETAYGKRKVTNQTVVKLGTNSIPIKGLMIKDDSPVTLILAAHVDAGQLKVLVPMYHDRPDSWYNTVCLRLGESSSTRPSKVETIRDKRHWKYKLLTFPNTAGTLYTECTRSGQDLVYKYVGTGVKLP